MWRDLGTRLMLYSLHLFASLISILKFALILRATLSLSDEDKKAEKVFIFLETTMPECSIFWIKMIGTHQFSC